jgi:hypothetical protein
MATRTNNVDDVDSDDISTLRGLVLNLQVTVDSLRDIINDQRDQIAINNRYIQSLWNATALDWRDRQVYYDPDACNGRGSYIRLTDSKLCDYDARSYGSY